MVLDTDNRAYLTMSHGNRLIKVTLEFPRQPDQKASQEFISRLKALYLEKSEINSFFAAARDKEEGSFE